MHVPNSFSAVSAYFGTHRPKQECASRNTLSLVVLNHVVGKVCVVCAYCMHALAISLHIPGQWVYLLCSIAHALCLLLSQLRDRILKVHSFTNLLTLATRNRVFVAFQTLLTTDFQLNHYRAYLEVRKQLRQLFLVVCCFVVMHLSCRGKWVMYQDSSTWQYALCNCLMQWV